jgi:hypothetical protein
MLLVIAIPSFHPGDKYEGRSVFGGFAHRRVCCGEWY